MKKTLKVEKPPLFYELFNSEKRTIILQGGTSSGKTYTTIDYLFLKGIQGKGFVITVVGQDIPNLKKGAYRDAKKIWSESKFYQQFYEKPNETDRIFKCKTGSLIEFTSYQDEQDAKSGKRDYLFVNEANGIAYQIFWQLSIRTRKKVIIDYNPTSRFWAHDLTSEKDTLLIISDHRHNPFLTEEEHDRIENIKDEELWKVYARGFTGKIEGLIYKNWYLCDNMPETWSKRGTGLDFGFTNDVTAIVDIMLYDGQIWLDEVEYRTQMTNPDIASKIKQEKLHTFLITADSSEPKSIAEIKSAGLKIEGAKKGQDSIRNGIDILKRYTINVTRQSKNIKKELMAYKWKVDKNGVTINEPIDDFNHALDAVRYFALNNLNSKPNPKGIRKISY